MSGYFKRDAEKASWEKGDFDLHVSKTT